MENEEAGGEFRDQIQTKIAYLHRSRRLYRQQVVCWIIRVIVMPEKEERVEERRQGIAVDLSGLSPESQLEILKALVGEERKSSSQESSRANYINRKRDRRS
jgi:hypothetical protein